MSSITTVSAELTVGIVAPNQRIVPCVASLGYSSDDPYAVHIVFRIGLGKPVEWACARELLSAGLEGRDGQGDVTVWPSVDADDSVVLEIALSSPGGQAHVKASLQEISNFLGRTYALVAAGEETEHLDIQAELDDLLRGTS